jgi:hypothetical protein
VIDCAHHTCKKTPFVFTSLLFSDRNLVYQKEFFLLIAKAILNPTSNVGFSNKKTHRIGGLF